MRQPKVVLILGQFGERKHVLDGLRARLRTLGFAPIVFDFEKPATKTLTESVRVLAGLSAFVVADITDPKSVPQEAMAIIPTSMVPFVPLVQGEQAPWAMLESLWQEHQDRVIEPLWYGTVDELLPLLGPAVVEPALERRRTLLARKAEAMAVRSLADYHGHDDLLV